MKPQLAWILTSLSSLLMSGLSVPVSAAEPAQNSERKGVHSAAAESAHGSLVHWQSWTEDLFERAAREKKLVILDLEAIWCHWCHVMEQKTYSNTEIAAVLKDHYICVKVDQDSRPDLSNRYED